MPTDATGLLAKLLREVAGAHHDAFAALVGYSPSSELRGHAAALASCADDHSPISLDFPSRHGFEGVAEGRFVRGGS